MCIVILNELSDTVHKLIAASLLSTYKLYEYAKKPSSRHKHAICCTIRVR